MHGYKIYDGKKRQQQQMISLSTMKFIMKHQTKGLYVLPMNSLVLIDLIIPILSIDFLFTERNTCTHTSASFCCCCFLFEKKKKETEQMHQ